MALLPILIALFALSIISIDLALATVWKRGRVMGLRKIVIVFTASLLGAVIVFIIQNASSLLISAALMRVLDWVFSSLLILDSTFLIGALPFFTNWIIWRPMSSFEKTLPFITSSLFLISTFLTLFFPFGFSRFLEYFFWLYTLSYCIVVLNIQLRNIDDKFVRSVSITVLIISVCLLPFLVLSLIFSYFASLMLPISSLSYSIAMLVFLYISIVKEDRSVKEEPLDKETITNKWKITEREWEIILLIKKGMTNKEIAGKLFIADNTVKNHIANIFSKTSVKSRIDLLNLFEEAVW